MNSKRRTWSLAALALLALAAAVLLFRVHRQPVYQGHKLSFWLKDYADTMSQVRLDEDAEALRHIGTNALPWLLDWTAYQPPPWRDPLARLLGRGRATRWLRLQLFARQEMARAAFVGFQVLGPAARPALPDLVRLAGPNHPESSRALAMSALRYLGPEGLPPLVDILEHGDSAAQRTAATCILLMMNSGVDVSPAIPGLLLRDYNGGVSYLVALEQRPDLLLPALTNCLRHTNEAVRIQAARNLDYISDKVGEAVNR